MPRPIALAALLPLLLGACLSSSNSGGGPDLAGHTYVSVSVAGHSLVKGTRVKLTFDDTKVSVSAGCNLLSGDYSVRDGTLTIDGLAGTEMGCKPRSKMDQDQWLATFLTSGIDAVLTGRVLTLSQDGVSIVLSERTVKDRALKRTRWVLVSTVQGSGKDATTSTVSDAGTRPTLRITARKLTVQSPCNEGSGRVRIADGTLTFTDVVWTTLPCQGSAAEVEQAMVRTFQSTASYLIDGKNLTVTSEDGQTGLVFRAS